MLAFIKEKLSERMSDVKPNQIDDTVPNSMVMECAHLIQELDNLSVEGKDEAEQLDRPLASALEIPLEDDIEIGSLELNLLDGRTTDTAADASVPTVNEYATNRALKTEEDFYKEACAVVRPLIRDNEHDLELRRRAYANQKMEEYQEKCIQEGVFGHDSLKISDKQVPNFTTVNFGALKGPGSPDYYVKLPIYYQVSKGNKVLKKQVEAISIINEIDAFKDIKKYIHEISEKDEDYKFKPDEIWDHATPTKLEIPSGPADKYVVSVVIDADWKDKDIVISASINMKGAGKKTASLKNGTSAGNKSSFKNKKEVIKEQADILEERKNMNFPDRFSEDSNPFGFLFQEEVDFGSSGNDTDTPPLSGTDTPSIEVGGDTTGDTTATTDAPPAADAGTDAGTDAPPAEGEGGDAVEVPVQTNDVSEQIADKVAAETQDMDSNDAVNSELDNMDGSDINFEDTSENDGSTAGLGDGLDTSMDDGSDMDGLDAPGEDTGDMDMSQFDDMSIEDLMNQGSEKLKSLSINQLKSFLSGENTDPAVTEAFQEAFFLTPRNINREIYRELKRTLGILNESTQSGTEILNKFKRFSKRLNRVLVKGSKMDRVFTEDERKAFVKLNKCLMDLNIVIGSTKDSSYAATIKRLIQAFMSNATMVEKIVIKHDPSLAQQDRNAKGMTNTAEQIKKSPKKVAAESVKKGV